MKRYVFKVMFKNICKEKVIRRMIMRGKYKDAGRNKESKDHILL